MLLLLITLIFLQKGGAISLDLLLQNWNFYPWKFLPKGKAEWTFCQMSPAVINAVTDSHNKLRAKVAKRNLRNAFFEGIPGSKTLFKLKYDCTHEQLARGTIGNDCKHSSNYMKKIGKGENFIRYKVAKKPNVAKQKKLFARAVESWMNTVKRPLSSGVVYTDTDTEPFANMIYNKTLKFGCSFLFCDETRWAALACVYDNRPKSGKPLYWADSRSSTGCERSEPCKEVIGGTDVNCDTFSGLCDQDPPTSRRSKL
ncbi:unnamed protein product [Cylicocyclus nassatus]|uniref:SCP domain-containing protein n=1 Tax=Cylicocyclus nassatus TaxID=53992 RepID=A0AA36GNQ0_CYLNA|nr:unnamed protein product [Cylicocyclus nassatus]